MKKPLTTKDKITATLAVSKKDIKNPQFAFPAGVWFSRDDKEPVVHEFEDKPLSYTEKQAVALYSLGMASAGQIFRQVSQNSQLWAALREVALDRLLFKLELNPENEGLFDEAVKIADDIDSKFSRYTMQLRYEDGSPRPAKTQDFEEDCEPIVYLKTLAATEIKR